MSEYKHGMVSGCPRPIPEQYSEIAEQLGFEETSKIDPMKLGYLSIVLLGSDTLRSGDEFQYRSLLMIESPTYVPSPCNALFVRNNEQLLPADKQTQEILHVRYDIREFVDHFQGFGIIQRLCFTPENIKILAHLEKPNKIEEIEETILDIISLKDGLAILPPVISEQKTGSPKSVITPKARRAVRTAKMDGTACADQTRN